LVRELTEIRTQNRFFPQLELFGQSPVPGDLLSTWQRPCSANDIVNLRIAAGQSKLVPELRGVASDAVISATNEGPHSAESNNCAGAGDPIALLPIRGYPNYIVILLIFNLRAVTILATQI
jgi:hypothetical protein